MASPAANPGGQIPVQQEQEKHFGPPVLGKKLFKAKAKALNNSSFRTLPKNIGISTDKKVRDEIEKYISIALNGEYTYVWDADASKIWVLYDVLDDYQKERLNENIHSESSEDWKVELTTIGGPEGHKVYFMDYLSDDSGVVYKEVYVNDIQYKALLSAKEEIEPSAKLFNEIVVLNSPMW